MSELTREQVERLIQQANDYDRKTFAFGLVLNQLLAHDAALRAKVEALEDWQATVAAALGREGGTFFDDVPKHISGMVTQLATLTAERDRLREEYASTIAAIRKFWNELSALRGEGG